ncbi:unnamed protein product, partial [Mycena citricolor]
FVCTSHDRTSLRRLILLPFTLMSSAKRPHQSEDAADTPRAGPSKRPRLPTGPDGFSKPKPKVFPKPVMPKFTSAFGDEPVKLRSTTTPRPHPKPLPRLDVDAFRDFVGGGAKPVRKSPLLPPPPPPLIRALKPPIPLFGDAATEPDRPRPPPPLPPPVAAERETPSPLLRRLTAPALPSPTPAPAFAKKTDAPLRLIPAPALAAKPRAAVLATSITTTHVARATDPLGGTGAAADFASIFMPGYAPPDEVDEETRGVLMSPEKTSARRAKDKYHSRTGLAAFADAVYTRHHASLVLWEKELAHSASASTARRGLTCAPDMRLKILRVLHTPIPSASAASIPGIALCHVLSDATASTSGIHPVLFSFSATAAAGSVSAPLRIRDPARFALPSSAEGTHVSVWKPWQTLSVEALSASLLETDAELDVLDLLASRMKTISDVALICDRFAFVDG